MELESAIFFAIAAGFGSVWLIARRRGGEDRRIAQALLAAGAEQERVGDDQTAIANYCEALERVHELPALEAVVVARLERLYALHGVESRVCEIRGLSAQSAQLRRGRATTEKLFLAAQHEHHKLLLIATLPRRIWDRATDRIACARARYSARQVDPRR